MVWTRSYRIRTQKHDSCIFLDWPFERFHLMCTVAIKINLNHMFNAGDDLHLVRLADAIVVEDAEDAEDGIADYAWLYRDELVDGSTASNRHDWLGTS